MSIVTKYLRIMFILEMVTFSLGQNETCIPDGAVFECKCIWTKQNANGKGLDGSLATCQEYGGRLATFTNMSQIQKMKELTGLVTDVFIGATRVEVSGESSYVWMNTTTEPFFSRWTNITDSHENYTCLALAGDEFKAIPCNSWIRYLCERDISAPIPTLANTNSNTDGIPLREFTTHLTECDDANAIPMFVKRTPTFAQTTTTVMSTLLPTSTTATITTGTTTATIETITSTTSKLLSSAEPQINVTKIVNTINMVHISNMSGVEVKLMVTEFSQVVATTKTSNQSDVRKMTLAMVKLSSMKTCDDATFDMYANSLSTVVSMFPSVPETQEEDGELDEQVECSPTDNIDARLFEPPCTNDGLKNPRGTKPGAILGAMENVMLATNITSAAVIYDSFSIQIHTFSGNEDMVIESESSVHIQLASTVFSTGQGRVFTVVYNNLHEKMSKRSRKFCKGQLGSKVISVAVKDVSDTHETKVNTSNAVSFTVRHVINVNSQEKSRVCVFWSEQDGEWCDTGCNLLHSNTSHTACTCNHLTSFAVLVLYYDNDGVSNINKRVLYILSAVGCSLSILGLAMTLTSYVYLRMLHRERILIHANLAASLMLAQIVFVASGNAHGYKILCKIVAVLMHFFFMAAFTWMMLEGLSLYLSCLRAQYNFGDMRIKYTIIGWGIPVIVVILSTALQFPHYGDGPGERWAAVLSACWLSAEHGLIWAFMAPVFLIVIFVRYITQFNLIILGLVIKVFLTLKVNSHKTEAARIRAGLRAMAMLLPLLGVTWLLSVLVPYSFIFHYLFVIGNSLQGLMIFFLHCLCNEEVRKFLSAKRSPLPTGTTSDTDLSAIRKGRHSAAHNSFDNLRPNQSGRRHAWT